MTGCQFAALIAQDPKRIFAVSFHELASEANVSLVFEIAAQARLPAIAVLTGIRTEAELVEQLGILACGSRWTITREHPAGLVTDDVLIGIQWRIRNGLSSSVMGLAPFVMVAALGTSFVRPTSEQRRGARARGQWPRFLYS